MREVNVITSIQVNLKCWYLKFECTLIVGGKESDYLSLWNEINVYVLTIYFDFVLEWNFDQNELEIFVNSSTWKTNTYGNLFEV